MSRRGWLVTMLMAGFAAFSLAQAQEGVAPGDAPSQARPQRGDRAGRERGQRGADFMAQYRDRMMEMVKQQSGASDEEWKALEPKAEKVVDLQREMRGGFGPASRRPGGQEGGGRTDNKIAQAQRDLRAALQDQSASSDEIRQKLTALREARQKAQAELEAAQKELKSAATPRLEAALVLAGLLE